MKRVFVFVLSLLMVLCLFGCDKKSSAKNKVRNEDDTEQSAGNNSGNNESNDNSNNENNENNDITENTDTTPDIHMDDIVFSSVFSDGVAVINLIDDATTAHVINKYGQIIFDFPIKGDSASHINYLKFESGLLIYDGKCYDTKGTVTAPESVGATSFTALKHGKYIVAEKITSTYDSTKKELGILNTEFEWVVPLSEVYYGLYNADDSFFWENVVFSADNSKKIYKKNYDDIIYCTDGTTFTQEQVLESYCANAAIAKITATGENIEDIDITGGTITTEDVSNYGLHVSENNKYILIWLTQPITVSTTENGVTQEEIERERVYAVCDSSLNWIVKYIVADDASIKGEYLCVEEYMFYDDVNVYYDLRTGEKTYTEPADFGESADIAETFELYSITNHYRHTEYVNGKAAVALWNASSKEMFLTLVDASGNFLFEPIKTKITAADICLCFDGEYIAISDASSSGTAHRYNSMTIYTYDLNGVLTGEWKASDELSSAMYSFNYSEGIFVFDLSSGTYSDYYRQSRIKYYTNDFKPLFD